MNHEFGVLEFWWSIFSWTFGLDHEGGEKEGWGGVYAGFENDKKWGGVRWSRNLVICLFWSPKVPYIHFSPKIILKL